MSSDLYQIGWIQISEYLNSEWQDPNESIPRDLKDQERKEHLHPHSPDDFII